MATVFAVDDSITIRSTLEYTLTKADFKVILAEDGVDALNKLETLTEKVNIFIFDVNMPNMDGLTLIKKVREIHKYKFTPILFLTTESQASKRIVAQEAGATGWIVKPFDPEVLISTLKRFT